MIRANTISAQTGLLCFHLCSLFYSVTYRK